MRSNVKFSITNVHESFGWRSRLNLLAFTHNIPFKKYSVLRWPASHCLIPAESLEWPRIGPDECISLWSINKYERAVYGQFVCFGKPTKTIVDWCHGSMQTCGRRLFTGWYSPEPLFLLYSFLPSWVVVIWWPGGKMFEIDNPTLMSDTVGNIIRCLA